MKSLGRLARKLLEEAVLVESVLMVLCFAFAAVYIRSLDLPVAKGAEATIPVLGIAAMLFVATSVVVLSFLLICSRIARPA